MKVLSIETSCDETAISLLECGGTQDSATFRVLGNALISQIDIHREYGGVFPALAKREHAKNLIPLLAACLEEAELLREDTQALPESLRNTLSDVLAREPGLAELFFAFIDETEAPDIDAIAVTAGPGLAPALWVGVNFAKALALAWNKPLIGVNHMEGHLLSALATGTERDLAIADVALPVLALLISGGHTELVSSSEWLSYELIGQTKDDAVGEAYDKVARMLDLPYPGGPEISKLAELQRTSGKTRTPDVLVLPRPMIHEPHCDFSFSGLKTAVLYLLKKEAAPSEERKQEVALAFEDAVADVLWKKTARALEQSNACTLVLGGGVSANTNIRRVFAEHIAGEFPHVSLRLPAPAFTTDNAIMIGIAGYYHALRQDFADPATLSADGNFSLI